jgi:processive 1,2-diacylglycerol beta-glucosyltransferase
MLCGRAGKVKRAGGWFASQSGPLASFRLARQTLRHYNGCAGFESGTMSSEMANQPKILIVSVSHGASHRRAAGSLRKAFECVRPELSVEIADGLAHCAGWFRAYYNSYLIPLKYWPALWGWIEGRQYHAEASGPAWLYRRGAQPFFRFLEALQPDIVIACEVGMCELAALLKRERGADFYLVGVAPNGVDIDRPWAQPEVDLFITAPGEAVTALTAAGVLPSKIVPCGAPIDPAFASLPDRDTARQRLDLERGLPLLLVLFGGAGIGNPRRIIPELGKIREQHQVVCIAGKSPRLESELRRQCAGRTHFRVLGWVDNMHEWMAAADLLLGKPGGSTLIEALSSGSPFVAFDPLPGNERRACDLIEKWQVGVWVRRREDLAPTIARLLGTRSELEQFRRNALSRARPHAARDAAHAILKCWERGQL